jgi:signal transduction histidine kinase
MSRGTLAAVLALAAAAAVLIAALCWISRTTLRLEAAEAAARQRAELEEKVRLALWRLDSALTPFVGRENARAAEAFRRNQTGTPADAVFDRFAHQRFEVSPRAEAADGVLIARLAAAVNGALTIPQAPAPVQTKPPVKDVFAESNDRQSQLNQAEFLQRSQNTLGLQSTFVPRPVPEPSRPPSQPGRVDTTFQPVWAGEELYLVRRVQTGRGDRLQAIRIDWPELRGWLLGQVKDLLPGADLLPDAPEAADPGRRLALLPVRLSAGTVAPPAQSAWTPARYTLAAGSATIVLVVAAVGILLLGSVRQSRRRGELASAVTHELRTPLTTFRLYTDMLAEGMVAPAEQPDYFATLRAEADRLGHLVENVLAYSRLERRQPPQLERVELATLLGELRDRLAAPAARAGMELAVSLPSAELAGEQVQVDRAAVERIALNLIDNACKYAASGDESRLDLHAVRRGRHCALLFQDHGPGIPRRERHRLFRPFHKSATRAAGHAPGVGLGLALSRRLARGMGGDLRLAHAGTQGGAVFELLLRRAEGT